MTSYPAFAQQLRKLIIDSDRVLLTMTTGPDGDSIGSMVAMCQAVEQLGRPCFCYSPEDIPPMFDYLVKKQRIMREMSDSVHDYPLVIIFDTGDMQRTPLVDELAKRDPAKTTVVNIDHHQTVTMHRNVSVVDLNFVDTAAAATTEMLYKVLTAMQIDLSPHAATSLLTGILTDTSHFSNMGTTLDSMSIAGKLMAKGADHRAITYHTMRSKSVGTLKLWGRALSRLSYNKTSGVISTIITLKDLAECDVDGEATTGIANFLNSLSEGRVALVLQEELGGFVKGSLRTTSDVNVADMAKQFGGGGHAKAAGFRLRGKLVYSGIGWRVERTPAVANGS